MSLLQIQILIDDRYSYEFCYTLYIILCENVKPHLYAIIANVNCS